MTSFLLNSKVRPAANIRMNRGHLNSFSLILVALCVCLSFSSIASAFVMAPHIMANPGNDVAVDDLYGAVTHHNHHTSDANEHSHDHAKSHTCCDDDSGACSRVNSACATHCSVSVTESAHYFRPLIVIGGFATEIELTSLLSVSLDGPFKPPR